MPIFNSQIRRREIATTAVVEVLILLALGFAAVGYVEWSSDAAVAEFMSAAEPSASDPTFTPSRTSAPALRGGANPCQAYASADCQSGRTSAPRGPQAWQVNRRSRFLIIFAIETLADH
jgi:hypothetical protein